MAIPTVNALAQVMMREFGEDVSNSALIAQFEAWIQDVYDEIGIQAEWKYLWAITTFSTVVNSRTYALSLTDTLSEEIAIRNTVNNLPLIKSKRQTLMERGLNLSQSGDPSDWYVESFTPANNSLVFGLWPVPTSIVSFEILGLLQPQEFISSSQLTFPREFIFLLKDGVRIKSKEDDKDYTGADRIRVRFNQSLQKMKARNDTQLGMRYQMEVVDIVSSDERLVRLPPDHFRN